MKLFFLSITVLSIFCFFSCYKNDETVANNSIKTDTTSLPNTITKIDTLKVMSYNVLNYGDFCQGATSLLNPYFNTILQYSQPDLVSCIKMTSFNFITGSVGNLADDMLANAFNVTSNKYNYATPTNGSGSGSMSVLFYNKQKLSFLKTETLLALTTDFNLYKLFYNDVNLSITKDTTFLYVVVCHTKSGSASLVRDYQDSTIMSNLKLKFGYFPNLIIMGDFNTTGSYEGGYQSIINATDSLTKMSDPPYYPDQQLNYPGNWNTTPAFVAKYITTSTRSLPSQPNSCGTSGGGKGWYDHIFISPWVVKGNNYIKYIPNSYQTLGNDGNRISSSVNSIYATINNSCPSNVLDALFQFSDKYPIMINVEVKSNRNAISPIDPKEK